MPRWSPWRAARHIPNLTIRLDRLPNETGGAVLARKGDLVVIVLDRRLTQAERKAALAHELVHLERDTSGRCRQIPGRLSTTILHEENRVHRIVARRLVPLDELAGFVDRLAELGHGVTAADVADEFEVPTMVASVALGELACERARTIDRAQAS